MNVTGIYESKITVFCFSGENKMVDSGFVKTCDELVIYFFKLPFIYLMLYYFDEFLTFL